MMGHVMHDVICFPGRPPWYDSHGQIAEAFVIGEVNGLISHTIIIIILVLEKTLVNG